MSEEEVFTAVAAIMALTTLKHLALFVLTEAIHSALMSAQDSLLGRLRRKKSSKEV